MSKLPPRTVELRPDHFRTYSEEEWARIEELERSIEGSPYAMAVVDYLGRYDADGRVDETSSLDRRFGTRDMRHVAIYHLQCVAFNPRAVELGCKN